jgi:hypothetical protein
VPFRATTRYAYYSTVNGEISLATGTEVEAEGMVRLGVMKGKLLS